MNPKKNKTLMIKELKDSRGKTEFHLMNFMCNLARFAQLMHHCLKQFRGNKPLIEEAKRNYIISIVTSLETFYRDLFIYTLEKDEVILDKLLSQVKDNYKLDEFHTVNQQKISSAEIAATHFSFQNIKEIDRSISFLFSPESYMKTLNLYEPVFFIPSKGFRGKMKLPDQWQKYLKDIFEKRHSFVHDANFKYNISDRDMAMFETLALQLAQFSSFLIATRYNDPIMNANGFPVFLIMQDLLSDDWEVVENDSDFGIRLSAIS